MAIEIVDLPIENGGSFHSYELWDSLPQGKRNNSKVYPFCEEIHFER